MSVSTERGSLYVSEIHGLLWLHSQERKHLKTHIILTNVVIPWWLLKQDFVVMQKIDVKVD